MLAYSLLTWGPERYAAYTAAPNGAFARLVSYPELGRAHDDLFPGCRAPRVREHTIFYEVGDDIVRVTCVLHVRMDPRRSLGL